MELIQLQYFQEVAKAESISVAARTLHISQPALSISISKLEQELGIHLFDRVSGHIKLNAMGKIYLRYVNRFFLDLREAQLEIASQNEIGNTEIKIAGSTMGMCPPLFEDYLTAHPNQPLSFFMHPDKDIIRLLELGEVDMAICARQIFGRGILWTPLFEERLVIMLPTNHPLSRRKYVEIQDLRQELFIVQRSAGQLQGEYASLFDNCGFEPKTSISTNELEFAIRAVDAGAGIMVASFLTASRLKHREGFDSDKHNTVPLKVPSYHRGLGIARLDGHFFPKHVKEFYDYTIEFFKRENLRQEKFFRGVYDN